MACRLLKPDHTHTLLPPQHQTDSPSFFFLGCSASDKDIRTHTHMHAHTHIHLNAFIILHVDAVVLILFGFTCPFYYYERHFKSKYKKILCLLMGHCRTEKDLLDVLCPSLHLRIRATIAVCCC